MIVANDLLTNRRGRIIDEENFIMLSHYESTHKDGRTIDVHLAKSKLTSLLEKNLCLQKKL